MKTFTGKTLRWEWIDGVVELTLDRQPANEIGTAMLAELEKFVASSTPSRQSLPSASSPVHRNTAFRQAPICGNSTKAPPR